MLELPVTLRPRLLLFMEQRPHRFIRSAALAALSHFRSVNVLIAFDGDLAWYLLRAIRSTRWRLDVHIEGDWATLLFAIKSLAKTDRRFRIETTRLHKYALLVYTADLQSATGVDLIDDEPPNIQEPPSQRRVDYCKVFFNCGLVGAHNFLVVQPDDIPLLPFQLLLLHRMHGDPSPCIAEPQNKLKGRMDGIALYSPAQLVFDKLSEKRMEKAFRPVKGEKFTEWDKIAPGIRAFSRAEMDLRSTLMDKKKQELFDMLVVKLCIAHPDFTDEFTVLGFQEVLEQNEVKSTGVVFL
ncbi:uncharacterized protein EV420DRAFT_1555203 [Desarmillaria tabescens]|uniref:Uncharacterized protein n=1 Tax=Armillaria tabescens TaxID=1929756 RepID=A0AA39N2Z7_ARMTA|nr:uncharacterized protein EV420DRAFT_1555203 [Desarmillaria tabescens]KAK0455300.1 hypothetical protein EV420DRAFT_1555203 [Desarmillaria tabescens]